MANYELGGDYYAEQLGQQNTMGGQQQSPLGGQQQSPIEKPFDFNALNNSIGNLQTGIDSILTRFDTFKPGKTLQPGPGGPGIIDPNGQKEYYGPVAGLPPPPGGHDLISNSPGLIDPGIINPYQKNEDLDLTNRAGIMGEYSNYLQGGMGTQGPMPTMSRTGQFMGEEQSTNYANDFGSFLDTFGIRDRLQFPEQTMLPQTGYQV